MFRPLMRIPGFVPLLAVVLAPAIASPAAAQQRVGGETYVTQAGSAPRGPGGGASADPTLAAELRLRDGFFRNPPAQGPGAPAAGSATPLADGSGNTAAIDQQGSGNTVSIQQLGAANVAAIVQRGQGNRVTAVQDGSHNAIRAELLGTGNEFNLVQRGDDNQYVLAFSGSALDHSVVQEGSGLRATQVGVGSLPFGIQQSGRGMDIRIEHNGIGQ